MVRAKKEFCWFVVGMISVLIAPLNFGSASTRVADAESYSFVYSYGNAKIWVFVMLNRTFFVGPKANGSIFLTIYLEKLGNNIGVFINRLTFGFDGTQIRKTISPNVTLNNSLRSWAWNITFGQEDVDRILVPGQTLVGALNFEFRYDVIDSSGEYWYYRVNENIPATIQSSEQAAKTWKTFGTVFLIISLLGVVSAVVVLGLKIRRHKRATLFTKRDGDVMED